MILAALSQQSLTFTPSTASLAISVGFVVAIVALAFIAWRRSGYRRGPLLLETLRVIIAVAIALTLNQPEWRQVFRPETKPELVILTDASRSMETRDVVDPAHPDAPLLSRAEAARPLNDRTAWHELTGRLDLAIETFSAPAPPAEESTDLNAALTEVAEQHPRLHAVVLLSDGDWNAGEPPSAAATRLRMRGIPVFTVPLGSETRLPDVALTSFEVPAFAISGKPLRIPFTIESSLPRDEPATIEMKTSTGETIAKSVVIPAMSRLQDVITWKPGEPGNVDLTLTVPKTGAETFLENNSLQVPLAIRKEQLHVLIIESYPRWEYRYLRNALERDPGAEVNCLLFQPDLDQPGVGRGYLSAFPKDEELAKYDVVFLGDVGIAPRQLTTEQCTALNRLVRDQAAGLVFIPGFRGFELSLENSPLGELLPVVWDEGQPHGWGTSAPGRFVLSDAGQHSLLTKLADTDEASAHIWQTLPGFQWYAPALRAKAGTEVLATHGSETNRYGRVPLLVTKTHGAGKILFMGTDGAWRWRKGVEDLYHYRFWGQVVRWMAYQRNMSPGEKMRLFYSPDRPTAGTILTLNANVTSLSGEPLREGAVIAQISAPSGKTSTLRLIPAGADAWGLFTGNFTPTEPGEHRVRLTCAEAGSALETTITVGGTPREKINQPAKFEVLREIAQLTRGKFIESGDPQAVISALAALPNPPPQERRLQLWAHPLWAGALVLLLATFWIARKMMGAF